MHYLENKKYEFYETLIKIIFIINPLNTEEINKCCVLIENNTFKNN